MKTDFTKVKNIYIVCGRTDVRKGIDSLTDLVQDSFGEHIEIEEFHYHPNASSCDFCNEPIVKFSSVLVREESKFIPATLKRVQLDKFFEWVDCSPFFGKNALAKATDYTLNRKVALKRFLENGYIAIDNNAAENALRPNVIGRKIGCFLLVKQAHIQMPFV